MTPSFFAEAVRPFLASLRLAPLGPLAAFLSLVFALSFWIFYHEGKAETSPGEVPPLSAEEMRALASPPPALAEPSAKAPAAAASSLTPAAASSLSEEQRARIERYRYDLRAFSADLYFTGKMSPQRAQTLAYVAVSEAYRQGVPPALVFGVMMIENPWFKSSARSSAGALGLMQVMPFWTNTLGKKYGYDLGDDVTNVQMGIDILAQNLKRKDGDWRRALLAYNGCVRGTRTPDCFKYPDKVRRQVERRARYSCPASDFERCVTSPVWYVFSR